MPGIEPRPSLYRLCYPVSHRDATASTGLSWHAVGRQLANETCWTYSVLTVCQQGGLARANTAPEGCWGWLISGEAFLQYQTK
jgi:hypothetical protein